MPQAIPVPRKRQADSCVQPNFIVILATMVPAAFLATTFPTGKFDASAPTEAPQLCAP
jgi:hypothetical protein